MSTTDESIELTLRRALSRAERAGTVAQQANALDHLAQFYHRSEKFEQALPAYAQAIGLWRQILGPEHPSVGTALVNLGQIYLHLGRFDDATPVFRQALSVFEDDPDFDDTGAVDAFLTYLRMATQQGKHSEAEAIRIRLEKVTAFALTPARM